MLQTTLIPEMNYADRIFLGRQKRNSCIFYRLDTAYQAFRSAVCEKCGFTQPSLLNCSSCGSYSSCHFNSAAKGIERSVPALKPEFTFPKASIIRKCHCSVCGGSFDSGLFRKKRCDGVCKNNLHEYFDFEGIQIETICEG